MKTIPGRNQTYGHGKSLPVYFGVCEVEALGRTKSDGSKLFGVRVRDPRVTTRIEDAGGTAFDYDPKWRIQGVPLHPTAPVDFEADTVEAGVRESTPRIGTFSFELNGKTYELVLIGKKRHRYSTGGARARPDQRPHDLWSRTRHRTALHRRHMQAHRLDRFQLRSGAAMRLHHLRRLPAGALPENQLAFEVLAGRKRPVQSVVRTTTYRPT